MTDSTDNALKPCPFCSGKATVWITDAYSCDSAERVIGCECCNVYMPFASVFEKEKPTEADIAAWNRRADLTPDPLADPRVVALVEARKRHIDAVNTYNAKLESVKEARCREDWTVSADAEFMAMHEANREFIGVAQRTADALAALSPTGGNADG